MAALYLERLWELTVFSLSHSQRSRLYKWYFSPRANRSPVPMPSVQKCRLTPLLESEILRVSVRLMCCGALPESSRLCCFTRAADQEEKDALFWGQCLHREQKTTGDKVNNRDIAYMLGLKQTVKVTLCLQVCKHKYSPRIYEASDNNPWNGSWAICYIMITNVNVTSNGCTYESLLNIKTHGLCDQKRYFYTFSIKTFYSSH